MDLMRAGFLPALIRMTSALFVTWRMADATAERWGPVGMLEHADGLYRFVYTRGARTLAGFRPFPEMPELDAVYESEELFPLFANRLLAKSRPEYETYLTWSGFDPDHPPDPIAVLGITEGRRATDSLELFPCPVPDAEGCYLNKFFLHGVRYVPPAALERIAALEQGERLIPMFDDLNEFDSQAVAVRTGDERDRMMIGYVPRYLAREVRELCALCDPAFVELRVERVNGGAPLQQRLLCRMNSCWPSGFSPCHDEDFQPIVGHLPLMAT
jgi:hypothetical protein